MTGRPLSSHRALVVFLLALGGSVAGVLLGPRIVGAFDGAPAWVLPAVMAVSVLFAFVVACVAIQIASGRRGGR